MSLAWPPPVLHVLDRHRFLHVAYALSDDMRTVFTAITDGLGEGFRLNDASIVASSSDAVEVVWQSLLSILQETSVEWRVSIQKVGPMSIGDVQGMPQLERCLSRLTLTIISLALCSRL